MNDTDQNQEPKDTKEEQSEKKKRKRIEPGIVLGLLVTLVSIYIFFTDPSYEALIAIIGGIATIFTFISKERVIHKWLLVGILFVSAVTGIFYVRQMTGPEEVVIVGIFYDGIKDQEGDEYVVISNDDMRAVQLEGWTLHDNRSKNVFIFPSYEMQPGEECRIYTNENHPESCGFNFRKGGSGVWNNTGGDMATLRNADGELIDSSIDMIMSPEAEAIQPDQETAEIPAQTLPPNKVEGETETESIVIADINYDGVKSDKEPDEYVEIRNDGVEAIQLKNWILTDEDDNIFVFPNYVIESKKICRIYTNEDHPEWCGFNFREGGQAIWGNSGDCATLKNCEGEIIAKSCYP